MSNLDASRRATILDVAHEAGVSRAAVSKVIRDAHGVSPAMRTRVQDAIRRLDYRPSTAARGMRGASFALGMELPHLTNPFLAQIADGARDALVGTPYQLVVSPVDETEHGAIEALVDHRVDGIIALSPLVDPGWLETLAERVPLVMIGRHDPSAAYDTVVGDDVMGAHAVMAHLFHLGHRRVAHLTESEKVTAPGTGTPHALRLKTYLDSMRRAGLNDQIRVAHVPEGQSAHDAARGLLLETPRPTAVFAGHDSLALDVLAVAAECRLTPRDLSVVGYDDIPMAGHPMISLTSVNQAGHDIGRQAVAMLIERNRGRKEPRHHVVTPELVIRSSTASSAVQGD